MPRSALRVVLLSAGACLSGCGPVQYVSQVTLQATRAVRNADEAHAAELAPYEYTIAVESLHKARELAGYARWQESLRFGNDAIKYGRDAELMAREKAIKAGEKRE
jgi:hypothetical protein